MGSASDWPTMSQIVEVLSAFGVAHEAKVLSAHRMPDEMFAYGDLWEGGDPDWTIVFEDPHAKLHLYGKSQARPGRKMGHPTVTSDVATSAAERALELRSAGVR